MRAFVTGGSGFVGRNLIQTLIARGDTVRALARSEKAAATERDLGAEPIMGDLDDLDAMHEGMIGCDVVFHAAAHVYLWGDPKEFHHINVDGTRNVISAAKAAGVPRFVHVSTEAVLVGGPPLVDVDESRPLPEKPIGLYSITKGLAEKAVIEANCPELATMAIRPPLIWGKGDTSVLPQIVQGVKDGRFMWFNGGHYRHTTTHVANVCEGLILAAEKGKGGEVYFVTDGPPKVFRWFITEVLKTQGVDVGTKSIPFGLAKAIAVLCEFVWTVLPLKGEPLLSRPILYVIGCEISVNDEKARRDLGYEGKMSIEQGLAEMKAEAESQPT